MARDRNVKDRRFKDILHDPKRVGDAQLRIVVLRARISVYEENNTNLTLDVQRQACSAEMAVLKDFISNS